MASQSIPEPNAQVADSARAAGKRSGRRRARRHDLIRPIVERIPAIYVATGFDSERTANDLGVSRNDVLDAWNEHAYRKGPGTAPSAAGRPFVVRRTA